MKICPECDGGILVDKESKYKDSKGFIGCTNFKNGCTNKYSNISIKELVKKCPNCNNGFLIRRNGYKGEFYGCTNFPSGKCKYTENISEE